MKVSEYTGVMAECGRKAAAAQWVRDTSLVSWHRAYADRVSRMFKGPERAELERAYTEAYRAEWSSYDMSVRG